MVQHQELGICREWQKRKETKTISFYSSGRKTRKDFSIFSTKHFDSEKRINLNIHPDLGGTSNAILARALKAPGFDKIYAWFDEDDKLDTDWKSELGKRWKVTIGASVSDKELQNLNIENRKPTIIVSNPLSIEGLLIRLFEHKIPKFKEPLFDEDNLDKNKKMIKSALKGIFGKKDEAEFYKENLSKEYILKKAKDIEELRLLLSIFDITI